MKSIESGPPQGKLQTLLRFYNDGELDKAQKLAESITNHPFGWKVLGAVLRTNGHLSEAATANRTAVMLSSQDAAAHSNLGITLQELGKLDEAEKCLMRALRLDPNLTEAHYNLGLNKLALGRLEEAVRRDFDFLDVHRLTDRGDGFSNSIWHIDNYHLSPEGFLQAWSNYGSNRR